MIAMNDMRRPKGLFDPFYVPKHLLFRDQELGTIYDFYRDAYEDEYGINCLVHGIAGVGRTVFSQYFITRLVPEKFDAHTVYVDAKHKNTVEIVSELNDKIHQTIGVPFTIAFNPHILWMQFRKTAARIPKRTIFVIDNIDDSNEEVYIKLARLSKEIKASTIGILNSYDYRVLTKMPITNIDFDFEIPLDTYTHSQLYEIIRQRVEDTFPFGLSEDVLRYITDLVCEFDASRPKTSIEALKALWPMAVKGQEIDTDLVRAATARVTSFVSAHDYFATIETIGMNNYITLVVLESMAEHLMRYKTETYIDRVLLEEIVEIKCEELGVRCFKEDIEKSLESLIFQSVIFESGYSKDLLYVIVPPEIIYEAAHELRRGLLRRK